MRKLLTTGILILFSSLSFGQTTDFEEVIFSIWPQYDNPGVLVIMSGDVKEDALPAKIEFKIPGETEMVSSVGVIDTTEQLRTVAIETRGNEKWVEVTLTKPRFHFEFYYDPFTEDHDKLIDYSLEFGHSIPSYLLAVQQPLAASDFTLPEQDMESFQDQHGMTFFRKMMPPLNADESRKISFTYHNHTGETSIQLLQKQMSSGSQGSSMMAPMGAAEAPDERSQLKLIPPLVLLAVIAVIIGFLFNRQRQGEDIPEKPAVKQVGKGTKFCPQCGDAVSPGDKFCAGCGNKLNVSNPA